MVWYSYFGTPRSAADVFRRLFFQEPRVAGGQRAGVPGSTPKVVLDE